MDDSLVIFYKAFRLRSTLDALKGFQETYFGLNFFDETLKDWRIQCLDLSVLGRSHMLDVLSMVC